MRLQTNPTCQKELLLFCQEPSERYLQLLEEEAGDDPRSAAGLQGLRDLERSGGWMPTIDARDARRITGE